MRTGGSALAVAGLLVVLIAVTSTGEQDSELATDASELPTSTVSTTTTAPLLAKGVGEDINRAATAAAGFDDEGPPGGGLRESESNDGASTTSSAPAGSAPVRIARPSCAAGLGAPTSRTAPFTGLSAAIPSNLPAVLVKVSNNNSSSRAALIGLDQADVVFEERIEASATRFAAVFHSSPPPNVGPVRSGRTTDIQITQNLNRPVMGYSGSNQGVAAQSSSIRQVLARVVVGGTQRRSSAMGPPARRLRNQRVRSHSKLGRRTALTGMVRGGFDHKMGTPIRLALVPPSLLPTSWCSSFPTCRAQSTRRRLMHRPLDQARRGCFEMAPSRPEAGAGPRDICPTHSPMAMEPRPHLPQARPGWYSPLLARPASGNLIRLKISFDCAGGRCRLVACRTCSNSNERRYRSAA